MERDDELRAACFLALDALRAQFGEELSYAEGLGRGFSFRGRSVPFLNYQKGIYRAAAQRGPAALSIYTSAKRPYDDEETPDGFLYAYREGSIDQSDNKALRAAHQLGVPVVYFVGTRPHVYEACYPFYVAEDRPHERRVLLVPGDIDRAGPEPAIAPAQDELLRRYVVRETRQRLHQARSGGSFCLHIATNARFAG